MNLQRLNNALFQYNAFLKANPQHDPYWKWESQKVFQDHWNLEAVDFRNMFDQSLQNSTTRRLWKRENYAPKEMMFKFIDLNADYVRFIFQDLFNEEKSIEGRVDRFIFYCDELLKEYKEKNPRTIENSHFHDDNYEIISIYLSFKYPELYTPYNFNNFKKLLEELGSMDVPKINDIGRYFKIMRTINKFIEKEDEILKIHTGRINPKKHYPGKTLLIAEDFCRFISSKKHKR